MYGGDSAVPVDQKGGRESLDAAEHVGGGVVAHHDAIVDSHVVDERLDGVPSIVVHGDAQHGETLVFVFALEIHEPWDLDLAGAAIGGPEIQ